MNRYKFCPACAGVLKKAGAASKRCASCGFEFYNNPRLVVNIILENERGEVLFVKRRKEPYAGTWDTPGGFAEPGENAEQAARREVREETGLAAGRLAYLGSYADRYPYQGANGHLLAIAFTGRASSSRAKKKRAGDDAAEVRFFRPTKKLLAQIPFTSDRAALDDYMKSRRI